SFCPADSDKPLLLLSGVSACVIADPADKTASDIARTKTQTLMLSPLEEHRNRPVVAIVQGQGSRLDCDMTPGDPNHPTPQGDCMQVPGKGDWKTPNAILAVIV